MRQEHIEYYKDGSVKGKGIITNGKMDEYWEWFRNDGTKMRSGHFKDGKQIGEWVTYDRQGQVYKVTDLGMINKEKATIVVKRITEDFDLSELAKSVIGKEWGKDNEMEDYREDALRRFVRREGNALFIAFDGTAVAGALLATAIQSPYQQKDWLYVDEVDVKPDYRRQGIGRKLMEAALAYARKADLSEVWLGAIKGDEAANALYTSLKPSEVEKVEGYTYVISD